MHLNIIKAAMKTKVAFVRFTKGMIVQNIDSGDLSSSKKKISGKTESTKVLRIIWHAKQEGRFFSVLVIAIIKGQVIERAFQALLSGVHFVDQSLHS